MCICCDLSFSMLKNTGQGLSKLLGYLIEPKRDQELTFRAGSFVVFAFCLFAFIHGMAYLLPFSKHIFRGPVVLEVSFLHLPRVLSPKFTI